MREAVGIAVGCSGVEVDVEVGVRVGVGVSVVVGEEVGVGVGGSAYTVRVTSSGVLPCHWNHVTPS